MAESGNSKSNGQIGDVPEHGATLPADDASDKQAVVAQSATAEGEQKQEAQEAAAQDEATAAATASQQEQPEPQLQRQKAESHPLQQQQQQPSEPPKEAPQQQQHSQQQPQQEEQPKSTSTPATTVAVAAPTVTGSSTAESGKGDKERKKDGQKETKEGKDAAASTLPSIPMEYLLQWEEKLRVASGLKEESFAALRNYEIKRQEHSEKLAESMRTNRQRLISQLSNSLEELIGIRQHLEQRAKALQTYATALHTDTGLLNELAASGLGAVASRVREVEVVSAAKLQQLSKQYTNELAARHLGPLQDLFKQTIQDIKAEDAKAAALLSKLSSAVSKAFAELTEAFNASKKALTQASQGAVKNLPSYIPSVQASTASSTAPLLPYVVATAVPAGRKDFFLAELKYRNAVTVLLEGQAQYQESVVRMFTRMKNEERHRLAVVTATLEVYIGKTLQAWDLPSPSVPHAHSPSSSSTKASKQETKQQQQQKVQKQSTLVVGAGTVSVTNAPSRTGLDGPNNNHNSGSNGEGGSESVEEQARRKVAGYKFSMPLPPMTSLVKQGVLEYRTSEKGDWKPVVCIWTRDSFLHCFPWDPTSPLPPSDSSQQAQHQPDDQPPQLAYRLSLPPLFSLDLSFAAQHPVIPAGSNAKPPQPCTVHVKPDDALGFAVGWMPDPNAPRGFFARLTRSSKPLYHLRARTRAEAEAWIQALKA